MTVEGNQGGPAEPQTRGQRWRKTRRPSADFGGLGARVETILRLAEAEASELREEARQTATALVAKAEQDAAQIRAEAEAEARDIRTRAAE